MPVTPSSTVVGVFRSRSEADQAIEALYNAGFERGQMRYLAPNTSGGFFDDLKNFFTGASANTSQSEDSASNPVAALGLAGETAQYYSDEYNKGNPVLVVNAPGQEQEALDILKRSGAYNTQMKLADDVQPSTNAPQPNSYETSTPQSNAHTWGSYSQPYTAQETPVDDSQQDTDSFSAIKSVPPATPDYDPAFYPAQADESTPGNAEYSAAPFSARAGAYDPSQADVSTPSEEAVAPVPQENIDVSSYGVDEETPVPQADMIILESEADDSDEEDTSEYPASEDTSESEADDSDEEDTPAYQADVIVLETEADESDEEDTPVYPASEDTSESEADESDEEETSTYPVSEDEDTTVSEVDESDEEETPAYQADVIILEPEADESDEEDTPTYQTNEGISESEVDESDEEDTPVTQTDTDTYQASQANVQPWAQGPSDAEHAEELQQIQDQIELTQQQLQNAKARLEATKERENQYRKRQKQLQNARKHLQELQEELQATQTELQETETRVVSYQNPGAENRLKKLEKSKKSKNQRD